MVADDPMKAVRARASKYGVDMRRRAMPKGRLSLPRMVQYTLDDGLQKKVWEGTEDQAPTEVDRLLSEMLDAK